MKVIDLLNKIANGEIKDKTKFRIHWGRIYRDFYYDASEENQLQCLKNCSDDYSLYDDINLNDEVEIIEEVPKKIEQIGKSYNIRKFQSESQSYYYDMNQLIDMVQDIYEKQREIINKLNGE